MDNLQASVKILTIMEDSINSRTGGGFPSPVEGIANHASSQDDSDDYMRTGGRHNG